MNAIQPAPIPFQAHWDKSFGHYSPSILKKVARVAWDVFSVLIPIIALVRFGAYKLNQRIVPLVVLPAMNMSREDVRENRQMFMNGRWANFNVENHKISTPDGVQLNANFFRHQNAAPDTLTVIYFNPNGAISYQAPWIDLMQECNRRGAVCNFAVFDYRGTGDSEGKCSTFDDLVIDGASIAQWVREKIETPANRIHFYGWSLGGAVAAHVKALDPLGTPGLYVSERSLSSTDDMIEAHISPRMPLRLCRGSVKWNIVPLIKRLSHWLGQAFDVMPAFRKLEGRKLIVYHRDDSVIPFAASLAHRVGGIPHETLCLRAIDERPMNHHCESLNAYRNEATGNHATEGIGQFLFNP